MTASASRIRALAAEPIRLRHQPDEAILDLVETETDPLFRAMAEAELEARTAPANRSTLAGIVAAAKARRAAR